MNALSSLLMERPFLLDGGIGTYLMDKKPSIDDFGGPKLEGCMEMLNERRPDWVCSMHAEYLAAGADAIETNTFGANAVVLGEFGLAHRVEEMNEHATRMAVEVARQYSNRWVVGSIGPGSRLVSLGQVEPDFLFESYFKQARGLLRGGADLILMETCQDLGQIKASVRAVQRAMATLQCQKPIWVQITVEANGALLLGTEVMAVITTLEAMGVDLVGLNCGLGPLEMEGALQTLAEHSPLMISCLPNAGLPVNQNGQLVYDLGPEDFGVQLGQLCKTYPLSVVGGCCGTTPDSIRALKQQISGLSAPKRPSKKSMAPAVSSLYQSISLQQEIRPLIVGERANANGSKAFREKLAVSDFDAMAHMAKEQQQSGAQLLDVCVAFAGRNEEEDMDALLKKLVLQSPLPLMIDSTEVKVIERALQRAPGKCVINSIHFEDGGQKARQVMDLCRDYGACVVGLCIDENGMAKTLDTKLAVSERLVRLVVEEYGLAPDRLMIDPLTFTLATGDEAWRGSAMETLEAIRRIKTKHPGVLTLLGVSNVSFGLKENLRQALNAVMLYEAVKAGLDLAIFNSAKVIPLTKMPDPLRQASEDLIFDRRRQAYDPLKQLLAVMAPAVTLSEAAHSQLDPIARLRQDVLDGAKARVADDVDAALQHMDGVRLLNEVLLEAMKEVGDRFREGLMQLPFVLESAEVMRAAVARLEPHLPKEEGGSKGRVVLATVKGDVHDIGKNLVAILLKNNGYQVDDLGVQQGAEAIATALRQRPTLALGLSGLLVKSTQIMKEDLAYFQQQGFRVPVMLGGAALTKSYVEEACAPVYGGEVCYAATAFDGLRHLERIRQSLPALTPVPASTVSSVAATPAVSTPIKSVVQAEPTLPLGAHGRSTFVRPQTTLWQPPFWGIRQLTLPTAELFQWLDEFVVIRNRWAFRKGKLSQEVFERLLKENAGPRLEKWKGLMMDAHLTAQAHYGYVRVQASGENLHVLNEQGAIQQTLTFPRQEGGRRLCISDFFATDRPDVMGIQVVTLGQQAVDWAQSLYQDNCYTDYFIFHGLATELTEAGAERIHALIRQELGIGHHDAPTVRQISCHEYQGSRYSFGYPACPDLAGNAALLSLLDGEALGIRLSDTYQMQPEYTTCALVSPHPQATYFIA